MVVRLLLTLGFVVACGSRDDRAARAHQDSVHARLKAERQAAYIEMERARASEFVAFTAVDKMYDEHLKQRALEAQVDDARADLGKVKTAGQRRAIATKLDELEVKLRANYDAALAIARAVPIEQKRIDALPASCFTNPPPTNCKIPPEIAEGFWTDVAPDATGEHVSRLTEPVSRATE